MRTSTISFGICLIFIALNCAPASAQHFKSPNGWYELDYPRKWFVKEISDKEYAFVNKLEGTGNFEIAARRFWDENGAIRPAKSKDVLKKLMAIRPYGELIPLRKVDVFRYEEEGEEEDGLCVRTYFWVVDGRGTLLICSFRVQRDRVDEKAVIEERKLMEQVLWTVKFTGY